MDKDALLKMLSLSPGPPKGTLGSPGKASIVAQDSSEDEGASVSPTYLKLDAWDRNQGETLLKKHPKFTNSVGIDANAMADFHASAFLLDPTPAEGRCVSKRRAEFMQTLLDSPDYKVLHTSTALNTLASEMASVQLAERYYKLVMEDQRRQKENAGKKPNPQRDRNQARAACHRAVGQAVAEATKEVEELQEGLSALGCGTGGDGTSSMTLQEVSSLFQRLKNDSQLRRIMELAGRYRRLAQSKQRQKVTHGYDDMVGVELSGDVGRVLPQELAQLADPDFELDAMRRLVERQCLSRQYQGIEKVGKGPIVVCVDESGSMRGEPIANAKAFALAMAWIARHQKRYCCLVGYSGGTQGNFLTLAPGKWKETELVDWLEHFFSRGTDMDIPLGVLPAKWDSLQVPKGKTDLILLTDAIVSLPVDLRDSFNAWKVREQVKVISLIIGQGSAGELGVVSDETHLVRSIGVNEQGVERCLSL